MSSVQVFYFAGPILESANRGSAVRVKAISDALKKSYPNLRIIAGSTQDRAALIRELKREVENGLVIDFVYAENTNAPSLLQGRRLTPMSFIQHVRFLHWLKRTDITLGYFYRDVLWRFPFFKQMLPWPLSVIAMRLNWLDWWLIDDAAEMVFLPSREMNSWLPTPRPEGSFAPLPPGHSLDHPPPRQSPPDQDCVNLLYVGGLQAPVYSMKLALSAIRNQPGIRLALCCRKDEWERYAADLREFIGDNVSIHHEAGDSLQSLYQQSDAFLLAVDRHEYWDFAVPVKYAESIGHGLPVICCSYQKALAWQLEQDRSGWVVENPEAIAPLVKSREFHEQIASFRDNISVVHQQHSWSARARRIGAILAPELSVAPAPAHEFNAAMHKVI